ncbi:hypothetical protein ACQKKE_11950 [Desemzia incerta]|uniref:hypothetical protein n=1 Tax=Desemzia incerta TaxID=82801 RepID=UPI003D039F70
MDSHTFIKEIKLFFKENKKTFLYSIIIVFVLGILLQFGMSRLDNKNNGADSEVSNTTITPAAFEVYIEESQTGEPYTNSYILEEFFEQTQWMNWAEENSGVEISNIVDNFKQEYPEITNGDLLKPISSNRDRSSQVFTLRFNFGNGEANLAIANAYYELLMSDQLSFLQNKDIYTISEPTLTEEINTMAGLPVLDEEENPFSVMNIIIMIGTSLLGGIVAGAVISFARYLFNKEIYYSFSYSWNENDIYLSLANEDSYKLIPQTILQPLEDSKVVLNEITNNGFEKKIKENLNNVPDLNKTHIYFEKDVLNIKPSLRVDEFIIIVKRKETTKRWYNKQREFLKNYPSALIKIIQI